MGGLVDRAGGADHDRVWGGGVMLDGEAPWQEGAGRTARNGFRSLVLFPFRRHLFVKQTTSLWARFCATDTAVQQQVLSCVNTTVLSTLCVLSRAAVLTLD